MDDRVRVEDAEIGLASILILITFWDQFENRKWFIILLNFWEKFTKLEMWFQNTMIPNCLEIIPFGCELYYLKASIHTTFVWQLFKHSKKSMEDTLQLYFLMILQTIKSY